MTSTPPTTSGYCVHQFVLQLRHTEQDRRPILIFSECLCIGIACRQTRVDIWCFFTILLIKTWPWIGALFTILLIKINWPWPETVCGKNKICFLVLFFSIFCAPFIKKMASIHAIQAWKAVDLPNCGIDQQWRKWTTSNTKTNIIGGGFPLKWKVPTRKAPPHKRKISHKCSTWPTACLQKGHHKQFMACNLRPRFSGYTASKTFEKSFMNMASDYSSLIEQGLLLRRAKGQKMNKKPQNYSNVVLQDLKSECCPAGATTNGPKFDLILLAFWSVL